MSSCVIWISLSSNSLDWNRISYVLQSVDSSWLPVTATAQWNSTLHLNTSAGISSWITYVGCCLTCVWRYSVKIDECICENLYQMRQYFPWYTFCDISIYRTWSHLIHKVAAQKTNMIMRMIAIILPNGSVPLVNFTSKISQISVSLSICLILT